MNGLQVLVVDSHADSADSLALLLELCGHRVRCAYSAVAALQRVQSFTPEVVIFEIALTGPIDGYELVAKLSRVLERPPRYIALTVLDGMADRSAGLGIDFHLTKPVNADELLSLLERQSRQDTVMETPVRVTLRG